MRAVGVLLSILISVSAGATIQSVSGSGSGWGYCDGSPSNYFCMDQIRQSARRDATANAELNCRIRGGQPGFSFTARCSYEFCSPSYIPANSPSQSVSCRTDCSIDCEFQRFEEFE